MIFKASVAQAHGRTGTFSPGFGCTIADAVQASCSAYPFFNRTTVKTESGDISSWLMVAIVRTIQHFMHWQTPSLR